MLVSPMLRHAIESFEHGLEHFLDGSDKSRKFALLHIDQAVELLLKEKCIRLGKSIYKGVGQTLTIHEAFNSLSKEIDIPERARLEELHDLRNTIQHKGLLPDKETTSYYIEVSYGFARRFLNEELDIPIERAISPTHLRMMDAPKPRQAPEEIVKALKEVNEIADPLSRIVAAYTILERVTEILSPISTGPGKPKLRRTLREIALTFGTSPNRIDAALKGLFVIRGTALKDGHVTTELEAQGFLKTVARVLKYVGYTLNEDIGLDERKRAPNTADRADG